MAINYLHREKEAQALAEELALTGVPVMTVRPDVSDRGQVQTMVDNLLKEFCQLDILGCNSGVSEIGLASDIDEERWHRIFGVNVDGVHYCCQAVLPHMIHRKAGSIVTLSSMWGQVGGSCETAYSATKGAVIAYAKALAKEVGPSGIRVNCVAPRVIGTEMNGRLSAEDTAALAEKAPLGRIGTPEEAARVIAFLAGEEASSLTGQVITPNGGLVI